MIGLLRMLAEQAYKETHQKDESWIRGKWLEKDDFGLIRHRGEVATCVINPEVAFAASFRFWELVKACPLKMPPVSES